MEKNHIGGIHAKHIEAENVGNIQIQGNAVQAAELLQLAREIGSGEINADEIKARNVGNLQYISDPTHASVDDLRRELAALRAKLDQAIAANEFTDEDEAQDAHESLKSVEDELAKPQPNKGRVLRKLESLNKIVASSAELANNAGKVGAVLIQLAPVAATIWQFAHQILGV